MKLPAGFRAGAVAAGMKPSGRPDVAVLVSDRPASIAGLFTQNRVQAAPVALSRRVVRRGTAQAIVANSGNANACTGPQGVECAAQMQREGAAALGVPRASVAVASTGIIGVPMDPTVVGAAIHVAAGRLRGDIEGFARAIMTTDTRLKRAEAAVAGTRIVGVAKGSGMIAPEMATMLAFIVTDAAVPPDALRAAVKGANDDAFDRISVDGCMSTNDTLLVMANGTAGSAPEGDFRDGLASVMSALADQIVADGEGATKVIDILVRGAATSTMARLCARSVADSVLFRCAMNGGDPNWGRILAALGASGQRVDPDRIGVRIGGEDLCVAGGRGPGRLQVAERALRKRRVTVEIDLGLGDATSRLTTNDLSAEYVRINAEYTT